MWRVAGESAESAGCSFLQFRVETVAHILGPECPSDLSAAFESIAGSSSPDALIQQLMLRLWQLGDAVEPVDGLLRESALSTLICHLLSLSRRTAEPPRANAIAARDMRRLIEHVDAHLHEEIGLEDLAATSGWSVRHFTRVFRQSTQRDAPSLVDGATRRARQASSGKPQPARSRRSRLTCGFADQSHFTTCFRKVTGATPLRWRQDLRLIATEPPTADRPTSMSGF